MKKALGETTKPLVSRLAAIAKVTDPAVQEDMLTKMLKDLPTITAAMQKDPTLAEELAKQIGGAK